MVTEEQPAAGADLSPALEWASYACLAPLVLGLAAVGMLPQYAQRELAQRATVAWGAALLAFCGAVHWGLALKDPAWRSLRIACALGPAVCAAGAMTVGGQRGLALLLVGFGVLWLYEHRVLGAQLPRGYLNLRRQLSVATCVLLAVTVFVSDAAGIT